MKTEKTIIPVVTLCLLVGNTKADKSDGLYNIQEISINSLTKKMLTKKNINKPCDGWQCEEQELALREIWQNIVHKELIKMEKVSDFNDFDYTLYHRFFIKE